MSEDTATDSWDNLVIADRMAVDRDFQARVEASSFSNQGWELVMTAVEFVIVNPEDPDNAYIEPNTEYIDNVLPAIREADAFMQNPRGGKSFMEKVSSEFRSIFGGGQSDADRRAEAERLTAEYANALHNRLLEQDKWEDICEVAAA